VIEVVAMAPAESAVFLVIRAAVVADEFEWERGLEAEVERRVGDGTGDDVDRVTYEARCVFTSGTIQVSHCLVLFGHRNAKNPGYRR